MKYLSIMILCLFIGCSTASTSVNPHNVELKSPTYEGSIEEIHGIAYAAAKRAFPEEDDIFKNENGNVTIERDWFWRGDTIIEIWVKQISENLCIVEADSKPNWHRGNGTLLNVSSDELVNYLTALDLEYEDYINKQGAYNIPVPTAASKSTVSRLHTLKSAFEDGLISEDEYNEKRKQILDDI